MNANTNPDRPEDQLELLRHLVQMREQFQKFRIQNGNRLAAVTNGRATAGDFGLLAMRTYQKRFADIEESLNEQIEKLAGMLTLDVPILADVQVLRGIGPILAARLLVEIDFTRCSSPSSLVAYAGYAPGRDRKVKGQKLQYNQRLKMICYLCGTSFLRSRSPYRGVYDAARVYYDANRPDWTKAHRHQAAMRKMIKRFLVHLYLVGRTRQGLTVRRPYVQERLGHVHIDEPQDYGWPVVYPVYEDAPGAPAYVETDDDALIYDILPDYELADLGR